MVESIYHNIMVDNIYHNNIVDGAPVELAKKRGDLGKIGCQPEFTPLILLKTDHKDEYLLYI